MKNLPEHIVLFPDGNSRWAKQNGLSALDGYKKGYENLVNLTKWCRDRGVKILTIFGFSTENWSRPLKIVDLLMNLLERGLKINIEKYMKSGEWQKIGVRVRVVGQKERLAKSIRKAIEKIENLTKDNKEIFLNLGVSYGGRWDIVNAVKKIIKDKIPAEKIDESLFENYLSTAGLPAPDLIIRAGGEKRLSNFALWQSAYSELYFSSKYWPDFTEQDLDQALEEYSRRERRFGK